MSTAVQTYPQNGPMSVDNLRSNMRERVTSVSPIHRFHSLPAHTRGHLSLASVLSPSLQFSSIHSGRSALTCTNAHAPQGCELKLWMREPSFHPSPRRPAGPLWISRHFSTARITFHTSLWTTAVDNPLSNAAQLCITTISTLSSQSGMMALCQKLSDPH